MNFYKTTLTLCFVGLSAYVANFIGYTTTATANTPPFEPLSALLGIALIVVVALGGWLLSKNIKLKLESPTVIWVSVLALLVSSPIFPGSEWIVNATKHVSFMSITTPILAYAGLSLGKDIDKFKSLGWRIVVVSLFVFTGTFVLATLFAQIALKLNGTI